MLLVTGITGHSGRYFLHELMKNHYEGPIRCIVRTTSDTSILDNCGLNIEKVIGDLSDQEFINKATEDIDTLMHIASISYSVNVFTAAVKNNVRRIMLVHTTGIYSKYKSASEDYKKIESNISGILKNSNPSVGLIYLRPTMIYGYKDDRNMILFIKMVDRLRLFPVINHGKNLLQPVNGRDLGIAYYQVLNKPNIMNGDYILSGDKPITMKDVFTLISEYLNKKTTFINIPLGLGVFMARCLKLCTLGKVDYIEKVQRMGEDRNYSHTRARQDFGYKPMPFAKGLKVEIEEYLRIARKDVEDL